MYCQPNLRLQNTKYHTDIKLKSDLISTIIISEPDLRSDPTCNVTFFSVTNDKFLVRSFKIKIR